MMPTDTKRTCSAVLVVLQVVLGIALVIPNASAAGIPPSEWVIGPHKKGVLITFDGRTSPRHVRHILHVLTNEKAQGSFFLPGSWVAAHRRTAVRIRRAGMALGNRGYGSKPFTRLSDARIQSSISRAGKALRRAGVSARPFLRPPKGRRDLRVLRAVAGMGYRSVRWTYRPGSGSPRKVARRSLRRVHAGSIVSLDLWRKSNRRALPRLLRGLRRKGYAFRTLGALDHVHAIKWSVTLRPGWKSGDVSALGKALRRGSYPAGRHRTFGYKDQEAVIAFEKVHHMTRDAVVPPLEMEAIAASDRPNAPHHRVGSFVDVDISRQVLFEVRHHKVQHTLPVSTGGEYTYVGSDGQLAVAHTPRGHFEIIRKVAGWRVGSLGHLWYPSYFVGGFAIHGYPDVPVTPASHGCVRIPMYAAKPFFYREPIGVPVFVHN